MASTGWRMCLEVQRMTEQVAQRMKDGRVVKKPTRSDLEHDLQMMREYAAAHQNLSMRPYCIYHAYPPSTMPMASLESLSISDLRLETHHTGRVLIVRTLDHPLRTLPTQNVVEDINGDVERLIVYNAPENATAEQVLPKNCVFAIKEPFYKSVAVFDGEHSLRVDHPSDLVQLQVTDALFPKKFLPQVTESDKSAMEYKIAGNAALSKKDYTVARKMYTQGLQLSKSGDELTKDLLRNRALTNTYLCRYEESEADAKGALIDAAEMADSKKASLNNKAFFRAGRAAYELRKYQEAGKAFLSALKLDPNDKDAMKQYQRCSCRLLEQTSGTYDFEHMSDSAGKTFRLDHADFTSNTAVRAAGDRGRGLFAAKDIKAGELILCEKAFQAAFRPESKSRITVNINGGRGHQGFGASLLFSTIEKLRRNPGTANRCLDLYADGYQPKCPATVVDNTTVVDSFQVAAIIEQNCFTCPDTRMSDMFCEGVKQRDFMGSIEVWITSSYINHQCLGNAHRSFMGDMMIIRAIRDIERDEEIVMPYQTPSMTSEKPGKLFEEKWGFECHCNICVAESNTPAAQRNQRTILAGQLISFLSAHTMDQGPERGSAAIIRAKQLYRGLEKSYEGEHFQNLPRLTLIDLGVWLSKNAPNKSQVVEIAEMALRNGGYHVDVKAGVLSVKRTNAHLEHAEIDAAMNAGLAYIGLGQPGVGKQYYDLARELYCTMLGELRGFYERYQKFFLPSA